MRCTACGSSICGVPCATKLWKKHRPECRRLQAVAFGEEYARTEDQAFRLARFALAGDVRTMKKLTIGLSVAVLFRVSVGTALTERATYGHPSSGDQVY